MNERVEPVLLRLINGVHLLPQPAKEKTVNKANIRYHLCHGLQIHEVCVHTVPLYNLRCVSRQRLLSE